MICLLSCNAFSKETFEKWFQSLSKKEKIAQIFVSGLKSKTLSKYEQNLLREWPLGGIIYFKRNYSSPSQFLSLQNKVKHIHGQSPFTFTDQEGGDVVRIGTPYDSPTPLAVGVLNSPKVTAYLGRAYGSLLSDLNISSNLAPVVDIRSKNQLDFISTRSFSSDPKIVAEISLSLSKGMLESGVLPTLKHFPGLGGVQSDSHRQAAFKSTSSKDAFHKDWLPYKVHSENKIPFFVMTSHTQLILDNKDYGLVTYSKKALDILRKITSVKQVAMTDDLEMKGARIKSSFNEAALKSFMSGHDLILIGWSGKKLEQTLNYFYNQIGNPSFDDRLKESLQRLYSLKKQSQQIEKVASAFTKHGALKLTRGINSKISEYLVKKEVANVVKRAPSSEKKYFYYSSDSLFKRKLTGPNKASLLFTPTENIRKTCETNLCILHITGEKTAQKTNSVLINQNFANYIVLNSADPKMLSKNLQDKVQTINSYTRSYSLGSQVQDLLENKTKNLKKIVLK